MKTGHVRLYGYWTYIGDTTCCKCGKTEWQFYGDANFCRDCRHVVDMQKIKDWAMHHAMIKEDKFIKAILGKP
jgi:hypothetical protein